MRRFVVGFAIGLASIAPSWAQANDDQIAQSIIDRLEEKKADGSLRGFDIDLQVDQGTVWMKGTVASAEQRKAALDVARRVKGVEKVVNQLKLEDADKSASRPATLKEATAREAVAPVETPVAEAAPVATTKGDEQLLSDVLNRLQAIKTAGQLKGFKLDVHADGGVVWLNGHVASSQQHALVIDAVRRVPGVKQVVNELAVKEATTTVAPVANHVLAQAEGTGVPTPAPQAQQVAPMVAAPVMAAPPGYTAIPVQGYAPVPMMQPGQPMQSALRGGQRPLAFASSQGGRPQAMQVAQIQPVDEGSGTPMPMPAHMAGPNVGVAAARYDHPNMPGYAWPSYAAYPNYAAVTYPKQYSPSAWPYIGPFYPYPQVPLGWRKVMLEWDDGWWHLDFKDK